MKVFHTSWNDHETAFHEIPWKKNNFTVYPSLKSPNSSGFHPILQKVYEMICETIFSKTVCGIFFFCRSSFINNFMVKKSFSEPKNHRKLNTSRPIYFKEFPHTVLSVLSVQISWKDFFRKKFFFKDLELFPRLQHD